MVLNHSIIDFKQNMEIKLRENKVVVVFFFKGRK